MANFRSIFIIQIFIIILHLSRALYEDQVGTFDWKISFVGKIKHAKFDTKRIIVTTEENVLASLNAKNGQIYWKQLLEYPKKHTIKLLYVNKNVVTISGTYNSWFVRTWDINSGTLQSEWTLNSEKFSRTNCEFIVQGDKVIHIEPVVGSHLEITSYSLQNGDVLEKTAKISAPWIVDVPNCIITNNYYICLSKNSGSGQLYYINFLAETQVHTKTLQSLVDSVSDNIEIIGLESNTPDFLLVVNGIAKLLHINDDNLEIKNHHLIPKAKIIQYEDVYSVCQLEASSNPEKLVQVKCFSYDTGEEELAIDLDYPVGLGAPVILTGFSRVSVTDLLLSTSDDALLLVRLPEGKILWTREEALSNILTAEFLELPVSELDASIENEFKTSSSNILNMLTHRLSTQAKQLSNLIFGGQLLANNGLVRDEFGLHKLIVVATRVGKLFAIDTLTGSIAWSYRLPNLKPFNVMDKDKMLLFVQRTARYAPLPAQCMLVAEDLITGNGVLFQFDPITGYSQNGIERLNYKISQAILLPYEDENNLKPVLVVSSFNDVFIYPTSASELLYSKRAQTYIYLVDSIKGNIKGYNFILSTSQKLKLSPSWEVNISPSKLVDISTKPSNERVHSQGRVLPDRSVYYKYVNPNLIAVATISEDPIHKHVLSIYLIDGVTGLILYSTSHKRAKGPIHIVHSENWLVYSYFNERFRRIEIVAAELYEGHIQSNSTVFSSHAVSLLPHVQTQSYIFPANPLEMTVTNTERGITNKFLLVALSSGAVIEIPWFLIQPRFNDIPCGPEESCIPYMPEIPLPPEATINYNQTLGRISGITVAPARLESTIHVLVHGVDIFYTRVAPSKTFDLLKEDFDHVMIILVLGGLVLASYLTKYLAAKKALKHLWK